VLLLDHTFTNGPPSDPVVDFEIKIVGWHSAPSVLHPDRLV
jgi:hypothetical protein